jgi:hypothetical protein
VRLLKKLYLPAHLNDKITLYVGDIYDAGYIPSSAKEKEEAAKLRNATEADPTVSSVIEKVSFKYFMSCAINVFRC